MTTSLPVFDFSTSPEERANEQAKIDQAIANAEKAMKDAPAVQSVKAKLVKPKAKAKAKGSKSGRVVGISADENKFLQGLLLLYKNKEMTYDRYVESNQDAYNKILDRYNKN